LIRSLNYRQTVLSPALLGFITFNLMSCLATAPANAAESATSAVRVIDGDTIEINQTTYRLHGIDAPEAGQTCANNKGGRWKCGKDAIAALEELVIGHEVSCDNRGLDDYDRVIAVCTADGVDLNAQMVNQGLAWAFVKYSFDYLPQEQSARASQLGVFVVDTETPWNYRAQRWTIAAQKAPDGCPIKGNISDNGKIYHMPWSPWYDRTSVRTASGERWFCDETEARAAGWRAPYWGR
jgi:endonuclease YncB( thermonuclease family)